MKRNLPHSANVIAAVACCFVAVGSASGASAVSSDSRQSTAGDRCVERTSYARAERRDTLDAYSAVVQQAGHPTTLTAAGRAYGKSILLVSVRGWALRHDVRFDGDTYTLSPPDSRQLHLAKRVPRLAGGMSSPRTRAGVALGDPSVNVSRLFGNAKWKQDCGLRELAVAGPGRFGDWFAVYRADTRGKVIFVQTGDVANGIRHLWQQAR